MAIFYPYNSQLIILFLLESSEKTFRARERMNWQIQLMRWLHTFSWANTSSPMQAVFSWTQGWGKQIGSPCLFVIGFSCIPLISEKQTKMAFEEKLLKMSLNFLKRSKMASMDLSYIANSNKVDGENSEWQSAIGDCLTKSNLGLQELLHFH